jgi:hypothetical protein
VAASRRYTWLWQPSAVPCPYLDDTALRAHDFLFELCGREPQFYGDPDVGGTAFGFVEIHLTVHAKDQWKLPWRVRMRLIPALAAAMNLRPQELELRSAVKFPPHRHPGRAARWQNRRA